MIIPVRCVSCGNPISAQWDEYNKLISEGKSVKEALDGVKLERFCCRGAMMSHVESIDVIGRFK